MEEKLRAHMDELFRNAVPTEQTREIKEEILQNITDKYHDLLAEGKSEQAAYQIAISGIGDLDEKTGTPTQMGVFTKNGEI